MPIKTKFNSYVAPVVQQHMETPKDYSGMVNAVAKLGEVMVKSSEARDDSEVASKLSDYQTKSAMKLKELELNGTKDIEGEFTKWQGDFKAQASDGMSSYALKKFNENLYKVENPMSLRAKESQLNVDAAYQHDYTNTALANNVIGVQADPSSYNSLMQDGYNLINSKNSMLSIPQRINAFNEYRYKLTTNKAMGDYASGVGINDIVKNIGDGAYNVELEDKTVVSLDKAQNQALAKTMVTDDFNKRLMTDPKALKADVDAGKFPWKVKGIGELYNADDKASMLAKLDKAVEQQQIKLDDIIKQENNAIFLAAYNNDPVAIERARALAESPNATKTQKEYWDYIKNRHPVDCETGDEAIINLEAMLKELADVDIDREATALKESGVSEYQKKAMQAYAYIQDRNQKFKDLSPEYANRFTALVTKFDNLNLDNKQAFVKSFSKVTKVKGLKDSFYFNRETSKLDGKTRRGKMKEWEDRNKQADDLTRKYINGLLDIGYDSKMTQEQKKAEFDRIEANYSTTMRSIYFPFLTDKTTGKLFKVGSEVMIGEVPFIFSGIQEDGISPIVKMKR